jgi:hopene-associated glycosyltransferase HpnB
MISLIAIATFSIWGWLLLFHGRFWLSKPVIESRQPPSGKSKVAVVIPARDEAENIRQSLLSLLAQNYNGGLAIILVDDNSTDGTGAIAQDLASTDSRLAIISGKPLQPGWTGKLWAVSQGLEHPDAKAADYVLLTDADIFHEPDHISNLVAKAETDGLDLVSEMVQLHCRTFSERALIPAFIFFFQMLYPFSRVNDPQKKTAAGAGGTMLVSQMSLRRIDGVSRICHNLIDDVALAREIKQTGKIWLGHSEKATSLRIYSRPAEIWNMIARTAYVQLNHSPLLLLATCLGMLLIYVAPLLLLPVHRWPSILGFITWCMMAFAFLPTLRRYRGSPFWGFALPAIGLFYLGATIASAIRHYRGKGGAWKSRVYPEQDAT